MDTAKDQAIASRCCVCARLRVEGEWHESATAPATDGRVSHTYCPGCLKAVNPRRRTSGRALLVRPVEPPAS